MEVNPNSPDNRVKTLYTQQFGWYTDTFTSVAPSVKQPRTLKELSLFVLRQATKIPYMGRVIHIFSKTLDVDIIDKLVYSQHCEI